MAVTSFKTLLIEDNPADARLVEEALAEVPDAGFDLEWANGLADGLQRLRIRPVDLVLLDLCLPESRGLETLARTRACSPETPIIVLTGVDDRELAVRAVRDGAQDYLVKGQFEPPALVRSMHYALVRQRMFEERPWSAWKDRMTGLYNCRGFLVMGEKLLRLADTSGFPAALLYAVVGGIDDINQVYGREEGDSRLEGIAEALRESCDEADVVARVGGVEFATLCANSANSPKHDVKSMVAASLRQGGARNPQKPRIDVSWGVSSYNPATPVALDELVKRAEAQAHQGSSVCKRGISYL